MKTFFYQLLIVKDSIILRNDSKSGGFQLKKCQCLEAKYLTKLLINLVIIFILLMNKFPQIVNLSSAAIVLTISLKS